MLVSGASAWLAPTLADGYTALAWTRHWAAPATEGHVAEAERLRQLDRWSVRAVDGLAPLPQAREAAQHALNVAAATEARAPIAAASLYANLAAALERPTVSRWRRLGLTELATQARAREALLRTRSTSTPVATTP